MKKYVKDKSKNTATESKYINGKWKDKFFYLYCDICGLRYGDRDIAVHELCEED
ncbi:MAG TPA: hypothetical protein VJB08_03950 [Candidatus Nanoarchaeia archaeon]|nr:hypothetical protein [Candidatus Nanoarchaeia archaeon]